MDEIKDIKSKCNCEVFVKINKNLENDDIEDIKNILIELDNIGICHQVSRGGQKTAGKMSQ